MESGWLAFGEEKERFELEFASCIGVSHAVSANSCTSALEMALQAASIRGEVLVPSFTWVATANAVVNAGATPVFCEVDEATRNLTAAHLEAAVTPRTEAVVVVHYAGQPCRMDEIGAFCERSRLLLVEDCAETLGADWKGRRAGSFGVGCFSFYPTKAMTTGEGGMLTTSDPALAERVRTLSSHGVASTPPLSGGVHLPWSRSAVVPGHNYRMPNLLAALGRSQLRRLGDLNARRVALAERYRAILGHLEGRLALPTVAPGATHVYQMFTVQVPARLRDRVLRAMWARGIGANVHFDPPVHAQPFYRDRYGPVTLATTERLAQEIISLPIFPDLLHDDQDLVAAALEEALSAAAAEDRTRVPGGGVCPVRGAVDETVVIGAGLAGLGAAHRLHEEKVSFRVVEAATLPGGLARTGHANGFMFDTTGHFLHFSDPAFAARLTPPSVPMERIERCSAVLLGADLVPYPFQLNLWATGETFRGRVLSELAELRPPGDLRAASLGDAFRSTWGNAITEAFLRPYNEKLWGRKLESLPADCLGAFPPPSNPELIRAGCLGPVSGQGYNSIFHYPASGRLTEWIDALAMPIRPRLRLGFPALRIDLAARVLEGPEGEVIPFSRLVSTLPLPELLRACGLPAPSGDLFAAASIRNVQVGFRGRLRVPHHWLYLPDRELVAHRVGFPGNVNPRCCPTGCASLSIELSGDGAAAGITAEAAAGEVIDRLSTLGLLEADEVVLVREVVVAPAYVVYRSPGREEFREIREALAGHGVALAGRFGAWDYLSMEGAFRSGWTSALPARA